MSLIDLTIQKPTVYLDETDYIAAGALTDADKVRSVVGSDGAPRVQVFGGWELLSNDTVSGACREVHGWLSTDLVKWVAFGTNTHLQAMADAIIQDITPVTERGELSNPFTSENTKTTVVVSDTAHGRSIGDRVVFSNASAGAGITINGEYSVVSVPTANSYTITHSSAATSTVAGFGGTVDYKYLLPIGLENAIGALGFGTGLYSTGYYSLPGSGVIYIRTYALSNKSQNLFANPRGGSIYEWAPIITPSELVTNGAFATDSDWAKGAGWSIAAGVASASTSNAALSQTITIAEQSYLYIQLVITRSAGTLQISVDGENVGPVISAATTLKIEVYGGNAGGAVTLAFNGTGFSGTLDNVTVTQLATASPVPNCPTQNTFSLFTPEGFLMTFGTIEVNTGNFNPMHIRWSDISPNTHSWTPSATNLSGFDSLGEGSRIVSAEVVNSEIVIHTDEAIYAGIYVNNSSIVYSFRLVATKCGLLGVNARAAVGGTVFWWDNSGLFWTYAGGQASKVPSSIGKDMFDNIAYVQQDKVFATEITGPNIQDIMFLYPDKRDGTNEVSRYGLLCLGSMDWLNGTFDRTAWRNVDVFENPIAVTSSGVAYYQERGDSANGGNINWKLTSGLFEMGDGSMMWQLDNFVPDFKSLQGGCTISFTTYIYPQVEYSVAGPFNITAATDRNDMLQDPPIGRLIKYTLEGNSSPAYMRTGRSRGNAVNTGMAY